MPCALIEDILYEMKVARAISAINAVTPFHQWSVAKKDQHKLTTRSHTGKEPQQGVILDEEKKSYIFTIYLDFADHASKEEREKWFKALASQIRISLGKQCLGRNEEEDSNDEERRED